MTKNFIKIITAAAFIGTALGIGALVLFPHDFLQPQRGREIKQTRVIIPQALSEELRDGDNMAEQIAYEESLRGKAALDEGEILLTLLAEDFDGDMQEEQILAYRNLLEIESPIYVTYVDFDEKNQEYKRIWSSPTAATRPGTLSLYAQDLVGDRGACILVSGMNGQGEHTLTVFRKNNFPRENFPPEKIPVSGEPFAKIAELWIDGMISVQTTERTQAYRLGIAKGQSFPIAAYGHDRESSNILDQIEIIYAYDSAKGLYEQEKITRIPGTQTEQRRLRELLSGDPGVFENFIDGLWYYISPQGTLDNRQYIYFDTPNREIIFYGDEAQQIFTWQNSSATRYGLYLASQNISVSTLRRFLDIELESLDSIRIKVFEDVRLKIGVNAPWNGSYRKVELRQNRSMPDAPPLSAYIDARYEGAIGSITFSPDGTYTLQTGGAVQKGWYAFFRVNDQELLEVRGEGPGALTRGNSRETYLVEGTYNPEKAGDNPLRENLSLLRVRLGAGGIRDLHERAVSLSLAGSSAPDF
ncbi:MAG: pallilysin-related adhesin [Treponema sp.]|jgi:hypothetical protein|nr:pallilysin-related adhesin [Treponema sp.]